MTAPLKFRGTRGSYRAYRNDELIATITSSSGAWLSISGTGLVDGLIWRAEILNPLGKLRASQQPTLARAKQWINHNQSEMGDADES